MAIPPSVRLRGVNLNPRYTEDPPDTVWTEFWRRWEFDSWIKPMIDDAKSISANAIRIFGNTNVVSSGALSLDEYLRRWSQVLDYASAAQMYVLPCGGDLSHWGRRTTRDTAEGIFRAWGQRLSKYERVIGVDVTNEASDQNSATTSLVYNQPEPWLDTVRRLGEIVRASSGKPVTHSRSVSSRYEWCSGSVATDAISDFLSIHCYYTPGPDDPRPLEESRWGAGKELVLGEFGTDAGAPTPQWEERFAAVSDLVDRTPKRVGAYVWPTYDATAGASAPFWTPHTPRPAVVAAFRQLPESR